MSEMADMDVADQQDKVAPDHLGVYFIIYPVLDRKPMQFFQDWADMGGFASPFDDARCTVLDTLEHVHL